MKNYQLHRAEQAKQLVGCYSNTEEIRKGEISDRLANGYGSGEPMKFTKTGKEIKEKVPSILEALNTSKTTIVAQLGVLKTQIGSEPNDTYGERDFTISRYAYDLCQAPYDPVSQSYVNATDQNKWCQKYNDLCYTLLDIERDIKSLSVIVNNVKDDTKYQLTVSQLVALQFS